MRFLAEIAAEFSKMSVVDEPVSTGERLTLISQHRCFDPRQADGLPTLRDVSGRLFCVQLSV